jgi:hypothetical protein
VWGFSCVGVCYPPKPKKTKNQKQKPLTQLSAL